MPGVFQLLDTLRNKLECTLWHLRQQLRPSLRASEIRLRRAVRTDFLLRVPAPCLVMRPFGTRCEILAEDAVRCELVSAPNPLITGKLYGTFAGSVHPRRFSCLINARISIAYSGIPYATEQGIFAA